MLTCLFLILPCLLHDFLHFLFASWIASWLACKLSGSASLSLSWIMQSCLWLYLWKASGLLSSGSWFFCFSLFQSPFVLKHVHSKHIDSFLYSCCLSKSSSSCSIEIYMCLAMISYGGYLFKCCVSHHVLYRTCSCGFCSCQDVMGASNVLPPDGNIDWWAVQLSISVRQLCGKYRALRKDQTQKAQVP